MRSFKRHKLADNAHPLVRQLITIMNDRRISKKFVATKAGVDYTSLGQWQRRANAPQISSLEACLNVLGYELAIQKRVRP